VLLADAAHMTADAAGVGLSLLAVYWAGRPKTSRRTFGYERVIYLTGWQRADPVASLLIAVLIIPRTLRLLKQAVDVLLEATPEGVDLDDVRRHICQTPGVLSCHDLHAWTITSGNAVLSAHVVVGDSVWAAGTAPEVLDRLGECLTGHFDLEHSTFQLERQGHADHEAVLHS